MGSVGSRSSGTDSNSDNKYHKFFTVNNTPGESTYDNMMYPEVNQWFKNGSNITEWLGNLTPEQTRAMYDYIGVGYEWMNNALYEADGTSLDTLSDSRRAEITDLHNALSRFVLYEPINVNRACDFKIFGGRKDFNEIKQYLAKNNNILQNDAFLSASTKALGNAVDSSGLVIRFSVPTSIGAGAWFNGHNPGEREFLFNAMSRFQFNPNSLHEHKYTAPNGQERTVIMIDATWIGLNDVTQTNKKLH